MFVVNQVDGWTSFNHHQHARRRFNWSKKDYWLSHRIVQHAKIVLRESCGEVSVLVQYTHVEPNQICPRAERARHD